MKILILVLSAMRDPWQQMMWTSQETWDKEDHPQTETIYYCGKTNAQKPKVFFSPTLDEELERVSARTLEALEMSLNLKWDFIARPHSSTYVHKQNLVDFIETLPTENQLVGLLTTGDQPFLWGGGSYIMSRDVVKKLVAFKDSVWNLNIMEDNSITNAANCLEIPLNGGGRMASINELHDGTSWACILYGVGESFIFSDWADVKKANPHYFFRCKQDLKRHKDLEIFRKLHENL